MPDTFWMAGRDHDLSTMTLVDPVIRGEVELVADEKHLQRVVREGVLQAKTSLDIMTADFKAMLVPAAAGGGGRGRRAAPSIVKHLAGLAEQGVEVRLLHSGVPSGAALRELKALMKRPAHLKACQKTGGCFTIRRCPRLHSKAVVVDAGWVYLGSANLTGAGLGAKGATRRNFEMGVISRTPGMVDAVLGRFNDLWEGEHCAGCGQREVCPVPLEEPSL